MAYATEDLYSLQERQEMSSWPWRVDVVGATGRDTPVSATAWSLLPGPVKGIDTETGKKVQKYAF